MSNLRKSIYSSEHEFLRGYLKAQRQSLGLTQRALGTRMGVIYSFIGKVETGDRRLDVIEFIEYCKALDLDASEVVKLIQDKMNPDRNDRDN